MKNEKTRVKRLPKRGHYDKETINRILDENYLCYVAFNHDKYPVVIPTSYGRKGSFIYIHGSSASRMLKNLSKGVSCSVCVSRMHGLVLAKSGFHHSMNYESVVIFGEAGQVIDETEKMAALKVISDNILPGRWEECRGPNPIEMKATSVLKLSLEEASAKIRTGMPSDDPEDEKLEIWSGVLPVITHYGTPIPVDDSLPIPESVTKAMAGHGS